MTPGRRPEGLLAADDTADDTADRMAEDAARTAGGAVDIEAVLAFVERSAPLLPLPGGRDTITRWDRLARVAAADLTAARALEAHADAVAILAEAGAEAPKGCWGVFASEAPGADLEARSTPGPLPASEMNGDVTLYGTKPWCSLAGRLDGAVVTAGRPEQPGLYAVDLHRPGVTVAPAERWVARGLAAVASGPVHFDGVPATAVGPPGWYLSRPGFARGSMGVAACWWGGASALHAAVAGRPGRGPIDDYRLGDVDAALHAAACALRDAARAVAAGRDSWLLALRVRSVVALACERILLLAGHALGPGPLCFDEEHARRVADLQVYLGQSHAESDLAAIGRLVR
ncbi:MAG: acyl-CoA dehydrogenase [Acidimicrobiales bacterium]